MSMRVGDDSAERAQAEARAQDKKVAQQKAQRQANEATAFDRSMGARQTAQSQQAGKKDQGKAAEKRTDSASVLRQAISAHTQEAEEGEGLLAELETGLLEGELQTGQRATQEKGTGRQGEAKRSQQGATGQKLEEKGAGRHLLARMGQDKGASEAQRGQAQGSARAEAGRSESRSTDARSQSALESKREEARSEAGRSTTGALPQRVQARQEKGSGGGQQGGQGDKPDAATFRLPPAALMAPPPLAKPKETKTDSRLRELAKELAEKIVKNVRVGTNKMGLPEFQLELKSDVLKGLKVKVSGRHGRIRAHFASKDPQVIKQLRAEMNGLREALTARGLKVDALEIEEERG